MRWPPRLQDKAQRTATLYSCIGVNALEIADGLGIDKEEDIEVVLNKFQSFCIGETKVIYERYCFKKRAQEPNETTDTYVAALNTIAKSCEYGTLQDDLVRDRIVVGIANNGIRKRLLQELKNCPDICRANEATTRQLKPIAQGQDTEEIQAVTSQ